MNYIVSSALRNNIHFISEYLNIIYEKPSELSKLTLWPVTIHHSNVYKIHEYSLATWVIAHLEGTVLGAWDHRSLVSIKAEATDHLQGSHLQSQALHISFLFLKHKFLDVWIGGAFDFSLLKSYLYYLKASVGKYLSGHWLLQDLTVQGEGHLMILLGDKGTQLGQRLCSPHRVQWLSA